MNHELFTKEEFAEKISNDFCLGFQTAKEIVLKIMDREERENE